MTSFNQLIGSTYYDLDKIFLPYTKGSAKATDTKFFNSAGIDLSNIFEKYSNQPCNLTVNYGFKAAFQSKYFTPKATCSIDSDTNSATISISAAAFNKLEITGSGTQTITGVSGTNTYSKSFTGLLPDSSYSYVCTPSNTGTSPGATTTALAGTATTVSTNTLPIVKGVAAAAASATSVTISWAATNQSDCSYSYIIVGRATTSEGTPLALYFDATTTHIPNASNNITNSNLSTGTTYYFTITPYNNSNRAGTAVVVSATTPLASVLNKFTFNSVSGSNIIFNVNVSGCSSASIKDNNSLSTATSIALTNNAFNGTISVPFTTSYGTFTLSVYGGIDTLTSSITFTYSSKTYSNGTADLINYDDDQLSNKFPYSISYAIIGGGGGGGGGGANQNKGYYGWGGGGGGSGAIVNASTSLSTTSKGYRIQLSAGGGGAGGGRTNNGQGGNGGDGGSSQFYVYLNGQTTTASIGYVVGGGGRGMGGAGDGSYDIPGLGEGGIGGSANVVGKTGYDGAHGGGSGGNRSSGQNGGAGATIPVSPFSEGWGYGGAGGGDEAYGGGGNYSVVGTGGTGGRSDATIYYVIVP